MSDDRAESKSRLEIQRFRTLHGVVSGYVRIAAWFLGIALLPLLYKCSYDRIQTDIDSRRFAAETQAAHERTKLESIRAYVEIAQQSDITTWMRTLDVMEMMSKDDPELQAFVRKQRSDYDLPFRLQEENDRLKSEITKNLNLLADQESEISRRGEEIQRLLVLAESHEVEKDRVGRSAELMQRFAEYQRTGEEIRSLSSHESIWVEGGWTLEDEKKLSDYEGRMQIYRLAKGGDMLKDPDWVIELKARRSRYEDRLGDHLAERSTAQSRLYNRMIILEHEGVDWEVIPDEESAKMRRLLSLSVAEESRGTATPEVTSGP